MVIVSPIHFNWQPPADNGNRSLHHLRLAFLAFFAFGKARNARSETEYVTIKVPSAISVSLKKGWALFYFTFFLITYDTYYQLYWVFDPFFNRHTSYLFRTFKDTINLIRFCFFDLQKICFSLISFVLSLHLL